MAGFGRQWPESGFEVVEAGISPRQQREIAALLSEPTLQDAAGTAGVGERTLRRWLRQPNFSRAYLECRREAVGQATARLQQAAGEAVSALEAVMRSPKASPASRVTAARSILDLAYRAAEAEDITQRMAELETTLAGYQRVLAERGLL
jgi:hypothetical protein